mmetsp:Transcript_41297/g.105598  ORF Transcript_41297/g.105598 Transcript_41297/m.105598 type:complete len:435 (-) Transcript_41297:1424-2728(-)
MKAHALYLRRSFSAGLLGSPHTTQGRYWQPLSRGQPSGLSPSLMGRALLSSWLSISSSVLTLCDGPALRLCSGRRLARRRAMTSGLWSSHRKWTAGSAPRSRRSASVSSTHSGWKRPSHSEQTNMLWCSMRASVSRQRQCNRGAGCCAGVAGGGGGSGVGAGDGPAIAAAGEDRSASRRSRADEPLAAGELVVVGIGAVKAAVAASPAASAARCVGRRSRPVTDLAGGGGIDPTDAVAAATAAAAASRTGVAGKAPGAASFCFCLCWAGRCNPGGVGLPRLLPLLDVPTLAIALAAALALAFAAACLRLFACRAITSASCCSASCSASAFAGCSSSSCPHHIDARFLLMAFSSCWPRRVISTLVRAPLASQLCASDSRLPQGPVWCSFCDSLFVGSFLASNLSALLRSSGADAASSHTAASSASRAALYGMFFR